MSYTRCEPQAKQTLEKGMFGPQIEENTFENRLGRVEISNLDGKSIQKRPRVYENDSND